MNFALIGKKLVHSFSKDIHNSLGLKYDLVELDENQVVDFFKKNNYDGFNVTIPYKEIAYKTVDILDDTTKSVGSVNTVFYKGGLSYGYNTDIGGMRYMLKKIGHSVKDKSVLILGSGGTSKTCKALCLIDGASEVSVCSRNGQINYQNVYLEAKNAQIIINCTPVGMYPDVDGTLLDLSKFFHLECVADCVYNPLKTNLILQAEQMNIDCTDGLSMLVAQAIFAEEIWLNKKIDSSIIEEITQKIFLEKNNIVLVGMPGCGKSTIAKILSKSLKKEAVDTDDIIAKKYGLPEKIISEYGEEYFRKIEKEVVAEVCSSGGKIVATGGGAVLFEENRRALRRNGIVVYIDRNIADLPADNRPISKKVGIEELFKVREPLYSAVCDIKISNDGCVENTVKEIIDFYENFGH